MPNDVKPSDAKPNDATPDGTTVVLTRRVDAPPARVYEACTRPDLLARWFGPADFGVCEVEADVRVGGRFAFRMAGGQQPRGAYGAEGVYQEVVPNVRLVLSWRWTEGPPGDEPDGVTSRVTFEFAPDGDGTRVTLTHDRLPDRATADSHRGGWRETLDKLAALLADAPADGRHPPRA